MATHKYNIFVKDGSGKLWEMLPKSWSFTEELNRESTAQISLSFADFKKIADATNTTVMAVFTASFREFYIERDGTKIFWGALTDFSIQPSADGEMTITLKAVSWFGLLQKRICGIPKRVFTTTDAGEIAWTLIDESQTSDSPYSSFGITEGSITASKNRDRTYRFDNVKDSIIKLSNNNLADGFDFDIDNTKAFNVYYPKKGTNRFNIVFDYRTMSDFRFKKPLILGLTNKVHVVGAGENDDVLYVTRTASTSYRTDWKTLEESLQERQIEQTATLNDKGDRRLADAQTPIVEFEAYHYDDIIEWDDYNLGDTIKVNLPDLGLSNESKRVKKREFKMDADKSIGLIRSSLE